MGTFRGTVYLFPKMFSCLELTQITPTGVSRNWQTVPGIRWACSMNDLGVDLQTDLSCLMVLRFSLQSSIKAAHG